MIYRCYNMDTGLAMYFQADSCKDAAKLAVHYLNLKHKQKTTIHRSRSKQYWWFIHQDQTYAVSLHHE